MSVEDIIRDIQAVSDDMKRRATQYTVRGLSEELRRVPLDIEIRHCYLSLFSVYFNGGACIENVAITLEVAEERAARIAEAYEGHPYFTTRIVRAFRKAK